MLRVLRYALRKVAHMSPQNRKEHSESKLKARDIPVNEHLPLIEAENEVTIRSHEEVLRRLIALWSVVDKAFMRSESITTEYISAHELQPWLSNVENAYLFNKDSNDRDNIHFSWQLETMCFVAWCAGLLDCAEIPNGESSVKSILHLFPSTTEQPDRLRAAIKLRSKSEVLDRADLMYRLHWAVRNAELMGTRAPSGINGGVVQEWHRAVNWMICYDSENDWDQVGTDT
jgi:Domain of unknown function (DUF4272)